MWMLNTLRYISIGLYMPMFGLLAAGFLFTTLGLWFKLLAEQNDNKVRIKRQFRFRAILCPNPK